MSIVSKEEYWTTILNDYSQFGQITTEDSEFNSIANDVWNVLENSFIKIDDEESIIKWEEMTGLSGEGLTIFQRKVNILYTLTVKNYLPISLFTQAMDRLVGENNYIITFNEDTQKYEVECYVDYEASASFLNKRLANESVELEITPLPMDYFAADFLESTGEQYIALPDIQTGEDFGIDYTFLNTSGQNWALNLQTGGEAHYRIDVRSFSGGEFGIHWGEYSNNKWLNVGEGSESCRVVANYKNNKRLVVEGLQTYEYALKTPNTVKNGFYLFAMTLYTAEGVMYKGDNVRIKIKHFAASKWTADVVHLVPALDNTGTPCMFDLVTRQPFYNTGTGSFIVGMDMKQARKLSKLPTIGGTLTVSLPSNYTEDEDVVNSLSTAQENGWVITIQTYEAEVNAASTFALRRVWVRKTQNEQGSYVDSDGSRWQVDWCVDIVGSSPEAEGYELFRSVETATEYWGLTAWIDPEQEELLINDFTEND